MLTAIAAIAEEQVPVGGPDFPPTTELGTRVWCFYSVYFMDHQTLYTPAF